MCGNRPTASMASVFFPSRSGIRPSGRQVWCSGFQPPVVAFAAVDSTTLPSTDIFTGRFSRAA
jgi:hypothetical protein